MSTPRDPHKDELQSTYFVQDRSSKAELTRLILQDEMMTRSMGGVFAEQADPTSFHRVLDIGCGPGRWVMETAKTYPTMSLVGIDISAKMVAYARKCAEDEHVAAHVEFHVMDALRLLEFPSASFDLVNMRLAVSFVRTWDWPKLLAEFKRVTRVGGMIRLTEADVAESNSPALTRLKQALRQAFYQAGNFFTPQSDGLTSQLAPLLTQQGLQNVQTREYLPTYRAGTPEGRAFAEDIERLFQTVRPFIQKWTNVLDDYERTYQQAIVEMQQADFAATWRLVTAWGSVGHRQPTHQFYSSDQ
jgi:ubiquinone/menaquinone biosynthesis C-methylase UbiE